MLKVATDLESEQQRTSGTFVFRNGDSLVVRIPVRFRRRCGRQMVVAPTGETIPKRRNAEVCTPLVTALARALLWQSQLESGEVASLEELAAANGVDRSYVGRLLRVLSLSPDMVEAILRGDEPSGLSLAVLRNGVNVVWGEQGR